jgi:hypothetical protein
MSEILLFQAVVFACGTTAFVATLRLLRRYLELRHERPGAGATADALAGLLAGLHERLARIEQTAEATALEVERLAEAHRYLARLAADRGGAGPPRAARRARDHAPLTGGRLPGATRGVGCPLGVPVGPTFHRRASSPGT